jgi:predicted naringenin-chalcone synthase
MTQDDKSDDYKQYENTDDDDEETENEGLAQKRRKNYHNEVEEKITVNAKMTTRRCNVNEEVRKLLSFLKHQTSIFYRSNNTHFVNVSLRLLSATSLRMNVCGHKVKAQPQLPDGDHDDTLYFLPYRTLSPR